MFNQLAQNIKQWGKDLGFQQVGITDTDLGEYRERFLEWLQRKWHGNMTFLEKHGKKRTYPEELIPETTRIISLRMDYLPASTGRIKVLRNRQLGYVSRYALGRDYHRLIRKRLNALAVKINQVVDGVQYRVFCDSAPVLEKAIAEKAGLGWIGKHTNLIHPKAGSWFFLGEIYTNLPLPIDPPIQKSHCGSCTACIDVCPTGAIVAPYQLDARLCISYLTIELRGSIPVKLRPLIGNRIYGCDDCQLCCPWNKFARYSQEEAFHPRHQLENSDLIALFRWSETEFLEKTTGSAIRRIGYLHWLRNLAVALGNAPVHPEITLALKQRLPEVPDWVGEHIQWALERQSISSG